MDAELIGETPAPSRLGPVPEFGPKGESPPLRTKPVIVSWALLAFGPLQTETSGTLLTEQELLEGLRTEEDERSERWLESLRQEPRSGTAPQPDINELWLWAAKRPSDINELWDAKRIDYHETKRVVYRQYWQRDDPVIQLVPGETQIYSVQLNSGLSDQVLREFSSSLGLGVKVSAVELSAQLSGRLSRTVTITTSLQTTTTKQLTNTRDGYMRRVAVWHVVHSISLDRVDYYAPPGPPLLRFQWIQFQNLEFADIAAPQSSSFDVRAHGPV